MTAPQLPAGRPATVGAPADIARLRAILRLVRDDEREILDAVHEVLVDDPETQLAKYRDTDSPAVPRGHLERLWTRLLARAAPGVAATARHEAQALASAETANAIRTLIDIAAGKFPKDKDGAACARAQREALESLLRISGGLPTPGAGANVTVATQVNVGAADTAVQMGAADILRARDEHAIACARADIEGRERPTWRSPRPVRRIEDEAGAVDVSPARSGWADPGDVDARDAMPAEAEVLDVPTVDAGPTTGDEVQS